MPSYPRKYNRLTASLLISNFLTNSHISVVARKWIIIIQAKYLTFPLFEQAHKQMRHQQFIARTITEAVFPQWGQAWQRGSDLLGGSHLRGSHHRNTDTHTVTHRPPLQSHAHMHAAVQQTKLPSLPHIMGTSVSIIAFFGS